MRRSVVGGALVAAATALATALVGWWTVPLIGGAWALAGSRDRPVVEAALGSALGWCGLLTLVALSGDLGSAAGRVGAVFGLPGVALMGVTVGFAALLGGSAALVARTLGPRGTRGARVSASR